MSASQICVIFSCILTFLAKGIYCETFDNETVLDHFRRLREHLRADYEVNARPVKYNTEDTVVDVYIILLSIMDVNEEKQSIGIDCFIFLHWEDKHLTWNRKEFNNIIYINMPPSAVWKPDIYEIHTGGPQSSVTQINSTNIVVFYYGDVFWAIPTSLVGRCEFDYSDYPSDVAKCKIILENWTYRGGDVNFRLFDTEPYLEYFKNNNPYWNMKECNLEKIDIQYQDQFYPTVEMELLLTRRKPIAQYQLQWVISVMVVLLTLCMFWIPADIRQKLTLGCVVMIILVITLVTIVSTVKVSKVSELIARPIHITMFVVLVAIVFEIIIINFRYIQNYEPPEFILNIFSGTMGKILLIHSVRSEDKPMDKINLYDNQDELAPLQKLTRNENWQIISQILDRIFFVFYVLLLSSIPKTI